jgi:NAD+ synthase (glutamine-hydrolysing)
MKMTTQKNLRLQDDLIFDGQSFYLNHNGQILNQAKAFQEDVLVIEWDPVSDTLAKSTLSAKCEHSTAHDLIEALSLGIRDFVTKNGFSRVHLGLSGGIDSALVACLAKQALGAKNVDTLYLPSPISSEESQLLAQQLAKNLSLNFKEIPINSTLLSAQQELKIKDSGLSYENLQSRLRALYLMAFSNENRSLLLSTGNKSELSMGYSTLYGDMCGALNPIGDLYKTDVYALCHHFSLQKTGYRIPEKIFTRPPTAELAPNQKDTDSLPAYEILDTFLYFLIECGFDKNNVHLISFLQKYSLSYEELFNKFHSMEFKRYQSPPILKVRQRSFGSGWRFPLAKKITIS